MGGIGGRMVGALPRRWAERLVTAAHDLRMLRGTLRGQTPPYLVPRKPRTPGAEGWGQPAPQAIPSRGTAAVVRADDDFFEFPKEAVTVSMRARGEVYEVVVPPGQTLLEAGLEEGAPMPFSCAMGGCATCLVTLVSGEVHLEEPNCLDPEERAEGLILTCVTRPLTPCTIEFEPH